MTNRGSGASARSILVTGGAGFVGSSLSLAFKARDPSWRVVALDNLKRRGSELNLPRLGAAGVEFVHGDVRISSDLETLPGEFDLLVECSAEASVLAGYGESPAYVVETNLMGTVNCLEWARRRKADVVFLSTSRVYPIQSLNRLSLVETATRFELADVQPFPGASSRGISEAFPLEGSRSIYGATKLSSELLIEEYRAMYGIRTIVNRCGVLSGPWQMGKVEQGVFSFWMMAHVFKKSLKYVGFGGTGKQVRDLLHVRDLHELLCVELEQIDRLSGSVFNVGGGREVSLSLCEMTAICEHVSGNRVSIEPVTTDRVADLPVYITDNSRVEAATGWRPKTSPQTILEEIHAWVREHESALRGALG